MTKVISLSEEAYKVLKGLKRRGESFSDVIVRITRTTESKPLLEFAGEWKGNDIDEVFEKVFREREATTAREYRI
jgi:predicted CopG family antitoxin